MTPRFPRWALLFSALISTSFAAENFANKIPWAVRDVQALQDPDAVHLHGWIGQRINGNEKVRLLNIDVDRRLLDCFRNRPGKQSWAGEHAGKWLHAATLAWVNSGDPALRAKLDFVVAELLKCQLEDGYLGTYLPEQYWTSWDLWSHKYNLVGLLTYMRYTGNQQPLEACRKMADLICRTYGDGPGQRTINTGPHKGLAYSSVMEPMVELYRRTGEPRYLDFCHYILRAWETDGGPKVISGLLTLKQVNKVANGKAYELLSCLNSVLELYRTTGDRQLLQACLNAWTDIETNRLYITGTASYRELFRDDHDLPNTNNVGETCVTVTWMQFNAQLLRLTGEARFAEELERIALNQLIGSQAPDCDAWGYYVELEGKKPFETAILGHCCLSSGPRGLAMIPTFAASTDADGAVVNFYESGAAKLTLEDKTTVTLATETGYPTDGLIRITVSTDAPSENPFAIKLRVPAWSVGAPVRINGEAQSTAHGADGYVALRRAWKSGDVIELILTLKPRVLIGEHNNLGKVALLYGPLVLAADDTLLAPDMRQDLRAVVLPAADLSSLAFTAEPARGKWRTWLGAQLFRVHAGLRETTGQQSAIVPHDIHLVPFAEAGGFGGSYRVWLPLASAAEENISVQGVATTSRPTDAAFTPATAIADNDDNSSTSSAGTGPGAHWFAVTFPRPIDIRRITFVHGQNLTANGWFNTGAGKPLIQVQRQANGPWETIGELAGYPATTASDGSAFKREQKQGLEVSTADIRRIATSRTYTLALTRPVDAIAVRVTGQPSVDPTPGAAAVSCAELKVTVR